ncbi:MAG TPA: MarR family transcriptional regulator [Spirochaetia bacterium]|nr:MarR family transcriptional regulator [Spirochaetia bacterium]
MNVGERLTEPVGQSSARWQVLGRAGMAPQTVAGMAREMGLARQSVQRVVNVLKVEGLVVLEAIPGDKRTSLVALTGAGRKVLSAIYKRNSAWAKQISRSIPDDEFEKAINLLQHIGTILEENSHG